MAEKCLSVSRQSGADFAPTAVLGAADSARRTAAGTEQGGVKGAPLSRETLISLGDIVHNDAEVARLRALGLETVSEHTDIQSLAGRMVLVRAHGEPPSTYRAAETAGVRLIDATCPVVAALQKTVAEAFRRMSEIGGQVVIFGRRGHAEVRGLVGQVVGCAEKSAEVIVIESAADLPSIDFARPIYFLAQTTSSLTEFRALAAEIGRRAGEVEGIGDIEHVGTQTDRPATVTVHDTICRQVADRETHLAEFARLHDVVVFVAGAKSSNGKVLFEAVRRANPRSYKIENISELRPEWFAQTQLSPKLAEDDLSALRGAELRAEGLQSKPDSGDLSVGICGATSTPRWLMERVAEAVASIPPPHDHIGPTPSANFAEVRQSAAIPSGGLSSQSLPASDFITNNTKLSLLARFSRYVTLDTRSDPASSSTPSTPGQLVMLQQLAGELRAMGAEDIELKNGACLTATIPASSTSTGSRQRPHPPSGGAEIPPPVIGFLAHVDTSPDAPGAGVKPCVKGDWVISDGSTLLGADDKAGVAIIMTAAEILLSRTTEDPSAQKPAFRHHGKIRLAFTTDEEIGRGVDLFDIQHFGADFAYTVDGGELGELEYENFNAAEATITITGRSAHPGDAKGKMVNALRVAAEIDAALPSDQRPETTAGRDGFYHLTRLEGTVERAEMEYLIRDFDSENFATRKRFLTETAARHKGAQITIKDQYLNMREAIEKHPEVIDRALRAMRAAGVEPLVRAIRGGTDGARLSRPLPLGDAQATPSLPCPNLFTGGENFHSLTERVSISAMTKAVDVILNIAANN